MADLEPLGPSLGPLVVFLKSFRDDHPFAIRFLESFSRHNVDRLPLVVVVPESDVTMFRSFAEEGHLVIEEERFAPYLQSSGIHGNSVGYTNHQVIRMAFWELGLAANALNVDSEMVFLRDFRKSDFVMDDGVPYTFLSEDFELRTDPVYRESHFLRRDEQLAAVKDALGWDDPRTPTMHGGGVYNRDAWRLLKREFMEPRGLDYAGLLRISAIPPTWNAFWVQHRLPYRIIPRRPWYLFLHNAEQLIRYQLSGITEADVAREYIALNLNTGFSREFGLQGLELPIHATLSQYRRNRDLIRALTQ